MPGICTHLPSLQLKGNNEHCVNAGNECSVYHRMSSSYCQARAKAVTYREAKTCRMEETMKFSLKHD